MEPQTTKPLFRTENDMRFCGVDSIRFREMLQALRDGYGITFPQVCEAASYSLAMVLRAALGLSADRAVISAVINDSLSGWIAMAAARHLINAGSVCQLLALDLPPAATPDFTLQKKPLLKAGARMLRWSADDNEAVSALSDCHALLCGVHDPFAAAPVPADLIEALNEMQTPIHSVCCPPGIDPDNGARGAAALISSSTLSLGAPLQGLASAQDYAGRHYICDISFDRALYASAGDNLTPLFAEQPVIQIFACA